MQYAGQMLGAEDPAATGPYWAHCQGQLFPHGRYSWNDYHQRLGFLPGVVGIYQLRLPDAPGWIVLLCDDPDAADLPPDTPTAADPPTGPPPSPPETGVRR